MTVRGWDRLRLAASVAGAGTSAYLTALHYDQAIPLACPTAGAVNCERVLSSPQAVWLGLPVALWGLLWFIVAGTLAIASLRQAGRQEPFWLRRAGLGWGTIGAAVVVWLLYTELIAIGTLCLWCTFVHALVIGIFVLQVLTDPAR